MSAVAKNREKTLESSNFHGFLGTDADEVFCKSLSGQCNVYSLHLVKPIDSKKGDEWILVVTLSGKLFRFMNAIDQRSPIDQRSANHQQPTFVCSEYDLRNDNQFPPQYVDLEVTSSCIHQVGESGQTFLFLACVDNRSHLVDSGRSAVVGGPSVNPPGIIFIVQIASPWKQVTPMATIVRTLTTSYAPCLITIFPLHRSEVSIDDHIIFVSGTDRSVHGYRIEATPGDSSGSRDSQIATCECFLGETLTEFDTLLRRGKPLPGTILQLDMHHRHAGHFSRLTAVGFDTGHVTICDTDAIQNHLISEPIERHFDTPISALQFLPWPSADGIAPRTSLLVCPAIGPARLHPNVDESNWKETAFVTFPRSDQFDCITCAEVITVSGSSETLDYVLVGTFGGKVLVYLLDKERSSAILKRVHSFLSPVMKIRQFSHKYVAVLLTYTLMIFDW